MAEITFVATPQLAMGWDESRYLLWSLAADGSRQELASYPRNPEGWSDVRARARDEGGLVLPEAEQGPRGAPSAARMDAAVDNPWAKRALVAAISLDVLTLVGQTVSGFVFILAVVAWFASAILLARALMALGVSGRGRGLVIAAAIFFLLSPVFFTLAGL